jgi:hypothetical protein
MSGAPPLAPVTPADAVAIAGWVAGALAHPVRDAAAAVEARDAAADLAEDLQALDPAARLALLPQLPPDGIVRLAQAMPPATLAALAAELALASVADATLRVWLHGLCDTALRLEAEQAEVAADVLRPGGPAACLLVAFHGSGAAGNYARAAGAAFAGGGPAALAATLNSTAMPAELARLAATLHDTAAGRFGPDVARALVRGHLFVRLIAPAAGEAGAAIAATANAGPDVAERVPMDWLADQAVLAGRLAEQIAEDGDDPNDLFVLRGAALDNELSLDATFAEPSPPDPLGTLPAIAINALGQAIGRVRTQRHTAYDWGTVAKFAEADPAGFDLLLTDERCRVLDLLL